MKPCLQRAGRLLLAAATLGIVLAFLPTAAAQAPTGEGLVTDGSRPDVVVMYTGDVIGYLTPCG
jgi:hypothetical protein